MTDHGPLWHRHANPRSGWSRVPLGPLLVYAVYARRWRLLAAVVAFAAVNPVLFEPPADDSAWMTRGVYGEEAWIEDGNPLFGTGFPEVLNALNVPAFAVALYAAYRRRPRLAAVAAATSLALKLGFVAEVARYYEETRRDDRDAP